MDRQSGVRGTDHIERGQRYVLLLDLATLLAVMRGQHRIGRRQAGIGHLIEAQGAFLGAGGDLQVDVVRPLFAEQLMVLRHRLNVDAVPAAFIKCARNRIDRWIIGADIDIKTMCHIGQRPR